MTAEISYIANTYEGSCFAQILSLNHIRCFVGGTSLKELLLLVILLVNGSLLEYSFIQDCFKLVV